MNRIEFLRTAQPHLTARVRMYRTEECGRETPAYAGWGCPCMVSRSEPLTEYDALPILSDFPLLPGDQRQLGFVFLSWEDAVPVMRKAGRFSLWEGRFIGEATVVD